jgi:scyllo-inositol 2-dehydrogenase (NADP+)
MDPIRVGIAGLGRSGWAIHAHLLAPLTDQYQTDQYQIVAVVDDDPARRAEAQARFACRAYTQFDDLLADPNVELVIVALPSFLHASASIAALAAGKHVVCEKPMAVTLDQADQMVAAAAAAQDRVLTIFQQRRYNPEFVKIREIIASGLLGRIVQISISESRFSRRWDWQTLQKFGGGSLNNTGAHFLDQALQLFGPSEPTVYCRLERYLTLGDADDYVKLVFSAPDAPTLDIEISSCDPFPPNTWRIQGTQGGLTGSTRKLQWRWIVPAEQEPRTLDLRPTPDRSYNRDTLAWHEDSWEFTGDIDDAYRGFYHDLHATLRRGAPLAITPESVRRVMWLQEECHRLAPLSKEYV